MNGLTRRGDRAIAQRLINTDALLTTRRARLQLMRRSIDLQHAILQLKETGTGAGVAQSRRNIAFLSAAYHRNEGTLERGVVSLGESIDRELVRASPNLFCA